MSRCAFLPTPADPFLLRLWFNNYRLWQQHIDKLYVLVNTPAEKEVVDYIHDIVDEFDNTEFIYVDHQIEHGDALMRMLKQSKEDYVMFIEDDGFVVKPQHIDDCFKAIEDGTFDAVGSRRGSCGLWLYKTASEVFDVDNSGEGDTGCNFWPNFFFAKRKDLLKVTNFGAKFWKEGERVEEIKADAQEDTAGDTFVQGSLQLRAMGLKFGYVAQYHGNTDDEPDWNAGKNIWDGYCEWMHIGSLSSGFNGMIRETHERDKTHFTTDAEKLELERRMTFWTMALRVAKLDGKIPHIKEQYQKGLDRLVKMYDLDQNRIEKRIAMYKLVLP